MISKLIGIVFIVTTVYLLIPHWNEFWNVDACLDSGGAYNYLEQKCDHNKSHPYLPSYRKSPLTFYGALLILAIGIIMVIYSRKRKK